MKIIYIVLGFLFLGLGVVGAILPLLPATPFLIIATACFFKGSEKFHTWFLSTNLYKKYVHGVKKREMTLKVKIKTLFTITLTLGISFYLMKNIYGRAVLIVVLLFHYYYFFYKIKTIDAKES